MRREEVRRVTVDEDTSALVAKQVHIETRGGQIWHDLDWVYHGLQARGLARNKQQWRCDIDL